jgi:hypothetical protein
MTIPVQIAMIIAEGIAQIRNKWVESEKVPDDIFNAMVDRDPTNTKKLVDWMCREYTKNPDELEHIMDVANSFHRYAERNMTKTKDLGALSLQQADIQVRRADAKGSKTQKRKAMRKAGHEGVTFAHESDKVTVVHPENREAAHVWGWQDWCITWTTGNHFENYTKNQALKFYFILPKIDDPDIDPASGGKKYKYIVTRNFRGGQPEDVRWARQAYAVGVKPNGGIQMWAKENCIITDGEIIRHVFENYGIDPEIFAPFDPREAFVAAIENGCIQNEDGTYTSKSTINIQNMGLEEMPVTFHEVYGDFIASGNKFKNMKGFPRVVRGNLVMGGVPLESMEGCPDYVGKTLSLGGAGASRNYIYSDVNPSAWGTANLENLNGMGKHIGGIDIDSINIKSLEGCPDTVTENFEVKNCISLTDLQGGPERVGEFYYVRNNSLASLKGCATVVGATFDCSSNNMQTLEGGPERVGVDYVMQGVVGLNSLKGMCRRINGKVMLTHASISSLEHSPEYIGGSYVITDCEELVTLKGCPRNIGEHFVVEKTAISDLVGGPVFVGSSYKLSSNKQLETLIGSPDIMYGNMIISACPKLDDLDGAPDYVYGDFKVMNGLLKTLKGGPVTVLGDHVSRRYSCHSGTRRRIGHGSYTPLW